LATFSGVWIARDTVAIETSAIRATSSMVAGVEFDTASCLGDAFAATLHRLVRRSNAGAGRSVCNDDVNLYMHRVKVYI